MKTMFKLTTAAAALVLAGGSPALAQTAAQKHDHAAAHEAAGATAVSAARIGGKPDLNGLWQAMSGANWNLEPHDSAKAPGGVDALSGAIGAIPAGLGVVEGGVIPYKPEALAKRDQLRKSAPAQDPEAACYLPGIPRATYMDTPFQIIQGEKGDMLFVYEYDSANRVVQMKPVDVPPIDTWMGTSYGQWDGDTLKITTLSENPGDVIAPGGDTHPGVTWLDRSGNYLTGTATVVERYKLIDKDHIAYEATIDDPETYTRPWKITMILYRHVEPNAQLLEFNCVPFADMLLYGDLLKGSPEAQAEKH